jgi:hydroxymethylpyrimidine/phosphomethylpyrimidine kinase
LTLKILSVAGFDGSGGAGITSDAKIFSKRGILGLSAVTAMTAQNPDKIYKIERVSDGFFSEELKAVFEYFKIDAVKTGLIYDDAQSSVLSDFIYKYGVKTLVVDPVYVSTSSSIIVDKNRYPDFLKPLFERADVITPNIKEAELISGTEIKNLKEIKNAAKIIRKKFPDIKNIFIKGSHITEESEKNIIRNILLNSKNEFYIYESKRVNTGKQVHGTGCAFSACLASYLALGMKIESAVAETEKFISKILKDMKKIEDNSPEKINYITGNI